MTQPTVDNLTVAVNFLARSEHCTRIVNEMDEFIRQWARSPKLFAGEYAVLNPLVMLGVKYPDRYKALLAATYEARARVAETARVDYQRDLMRKIRARDATAASLKEHRRGIRMTRSDKLVFLAQLHQEWNAAKRRYVEASDLSPREAVREFWDTIDAALERDQRQVMETV
jgi:hypothetical protein